MSRRPERTYETATARLEEIIRRLDSGEAGLRETLDLVTRGPRARRVLRRRARRRRPGPRGAAPRRARGAARGAMHDRRRPSEHLRPIADLPLEVEGYALDGARARRLERLHAPVHRDPPARRRRGGPRRGRHLRRARPRVLQDGRRRRCRWPASWTLGSFCDHLETLDLLAGAAARDASRPYRHLGLRVGRARPRPAPGRHAAARGAGARAAPGHLRRLAAAGRAGDARRRSRGASRRYPALRFKLDPTRDWDDALIAEPRRHRRRRLASTSRASTRARSSTTPADPELYRRVAEAFPDAWIEDPKLTAETDAGRCARTATASRWDAQHPLGRRHRGACRSRRGWSTSSRRASGRCASCSPPTTTARSAASACTAAASSSSAAGRGHIQYLASIFHPDAPNDVAPGGYNDADPAPGLPALAAGAADRPHRLPLGLAEGVQPTLQERALRGVLGARDRRRRRPPRAALVAERAAAGRRAPRGTGGSRRGRARRRAPAPRAGPVDLGRRRPRGSARPPASGRAPGAGRRARRSGASRCPPRSRRRCGRR